MLASLMYLLGYHLFLISQGLTTNEHVKGGGQPGSSKGCGVHCTRACTERVPPSRLAYLRRGDDYPGDLDAAAATQPPPRPSRDTVEVLVVESGSGGGVVRRDADDRASPTKGGGDAASTGPHSPGVSVPDRNRV